MTAAFAFCTLAIFALAMPADAATLNVPSQYSTIQAAITAASNSDTVLVAAGTYSGPGNRDIDFGGKNLTVTSSAGAASTIIDCGGYASSDHSGDHRGFYLHSGETAAVINGFTVENGYKSFTSSPPTDESGSGGGIYIANSTGTITVSNCILTGNTAASFFGGGIDTENYYGGTIVLTGCIVTGNTATYDGGIYNNNGNGTVMMTNCTVTANTNGGLSNNNSGTITMTNCTVNGNTAGMTGGNAGGVFNINGGTITLTGCTINNNAAASFGGVDNENTGSGTIVLTDCAIEGNTVGSVGGSGSAGGVGNDNNTGTITLTNCVIAGNTDYSNGGSAVANLNPKSGTITLTNCTVTGNVAGSTGSVYNDNGTGGGITLINDIVYGDSSDNGTEILNAAGSPPIAVASHCDVQGGYPGVGNINADPLFVNAPTDLHLQPGSPCLGAGTATGAPTTTIDGQTRPVPPSIGAYEAAAPGHAQLLWNNVSGQAALWNINPDGIYASVAYGPFSGWTAKAVSEAPDGADWLLWTNTSGEVSLWRVTGSGYSTVQYGPYANFAAVSLSIGADGNPRLLWDETNGTASLWNINQANGAFTHTEYGPYAGWTANEVASGATVTDLLWTNTNGTAAGWRIAADGTIATSAFGPFNGYSAVGLSVGPDDGAHLLWDSTSGSEALWSADFSAGTFTATSYGPFSGYAARAIATGPDGSTHLLWDATSGQVSLWDVTGSSYTHQEFGPFSGWTAVAVSAGM